MISSNPSILIVEDERIVAKDLQQTLCDMGYDAFAIASSADEAIARVSQRCPDIALMDIRIKGARDGIQTAEILRKRFDIPVIYLTAHADEATIERAKVTQPHGYLLKPVKAAELRSSIEVALFKHQMERRLREREVWFSATLRSIADAVVTVDIGGKITFMNPAAEALIGLQSASVTGKRAREVLRLVDQQSLETGETPLDMALRMMQPIELHEATLQNLSTGEQRMIADTASPVADDQLTLGAVMVFRDVTEQKNQMQKRLEFADRLASLGTMAAGTAHELNNPLTVVVGNAALAAEDLERHQAELKAGISPQAAEQRLKAMADALRDLRSAAGRMGRIISDLQTFARPVPEAPGLVDLAQCVEWAVRTTAHQFRHRARLVRCLGNVPLVKADEMRLGQVIINLLVNAAQSIPTGNADRNEVTVTTGTDLQGRAFADVRDTGAGISPDVLPRIFDPFFTTKETGAGTGLGLSICHGIVRSLGGEITVDSQVGKGSTFRVTLPPVNPDAMEEARTDVRTDQPPSARILVVDDEVMLLRIMQRMLEDSDHEVVCTETAPEALKLIDRGERFDVIISDLMMPNMTGMDFYEAVLGRNPDLARRIVFMSGGATTGRAAHFLASVSNTHLAKPFKSRNLAEAVQQILTAQNPRTVMAG
jgi:two-component system cell cycle sensor histidine kinase/response regulator CckA